MEDGSSSDGNVCFSNFGHTNYAECPAESNNGIPDYDMMKLMLTETGEFHYDRSMQYFTNISRVYMFSKKKNWLDICICFVENIRPVAKDKKWMRELKQLSFALSCRLVISSILCV
ncbi:hypothetical protein MKW92_051769 [Papaver armeniacum]|nr:hypothetical protein MKW92_051769 [Papaver armeniacum]